MNDNKQNLDSLLEDFLQENRVEDNGFSDKVMTALPQQPRLVWITHLYPVLAIVAGVVGAWQFGFLSPQTAMVWVSKLAVLWNTHVDFSATLSISLIVGMLALGGYLFSEKVKNL